MAESLSNKQLFFYTLVILLAGVLFGSVALFYPFGRDQGIYAYAGKLLLEGKIDYKYLFDVKPPGVHFTFAFAQLIFGSSMFSMRAFDILWQSFTGLIIFQITYKVTFSKFTGLLSAFIYIFLYFRMDYWHTLQADGFLNLPFALSVLLIIASREGKEYLPVFLSGILFALTILFKYTLAVFLPFVIVIFIFHNKLPVGTRMKKAVIYVSGFVLMNLLTLSLYYFSGALNEFIDVQFVQTPLYAKIGYETESAGFITANIIRLFFGSVYTPLIWASVLAAVYLIAKKQFDYRMAFIYAWIISSLIGLVIQWKFFLYHFLVIIPSLAAGASVFIIRLQKALKEKFPKAALVSIVLILAGYFLLGFKPYMSSYEDVFSYLKGSKTMEQLYVEKGITSDSAFMIGKTFNAINYVKNNTYENDGIYVWGFDPLIYYLSGRHCVSRFVYNFPLYWKESNYGFQKEFIDDLIKDKPKLILVSYRDPLYFISGFKEDSKLLIDRVPGFKSFLEENYLYDTRLDDFDFYKLKN